MNVSIPYGKWNLADRLENDMKNVVSIPYGKWNRERLPNKLHDQVVSIPYGKWNQICLKYCLVYSCFNTLWEMEPLHGPMTDRSQVFQYPMGNGTTNAIVREAGGLKFQYPMGNGTQTHVGQQEVGHVSIPYGKWNQEKIRFCRATAGFQYPMGNGTNNNLLLGLL